MWIIVIMSYVGAYTKAYIPVIRFRAARDSQVGKIKSTHVFVHLHEWEYYDCDDIYVVYHNGMLIETYKEYYMHYVSFRVLCSLWIMLSSFHLTETLLNSKFQWSIYFRLNILPLLAS